MAPRSKDINERAVWSIYEFITRNVSATLVKLPLGLWMLRRLRKIVWRLSSVMIPNPILVLGYYIYWYPEAYRGAVEYASGHYELGTTLLFQKLLRPDMVVVDLGASLGYYTLLAARQVGKDGKVYAFEPQPWNCDALRKSVQINRYENIVTVVEKAVSNRQGSSPLFIVEPGSGEASLYRRPRAGMQKIEIQKTTLDAFFEKEGWPSVDIIKMDIEGEEKAALEGMMEVSRRNPQIKLIIEFTPDILKTVGISPVEWFATIQRLGFTRIWAISKGWELPLEIPQDIHGLVHRAGNGSLNLLCEKP